MGLRDERWIREKYNSINKENQSNYMFVSLKIKRLRNVNQHFGWAAGDELLKKVYEILLSEMRQGEYIAHIYGGTFNLLIYNDSHEDKIEYEDYSFLPIRFTSYDEAITARITKFSRIIRDLQDERFQGNIFTGWGIYKLSDKMLDFEVAQYNADICRSESTGSMRWGSHFEIYNVTYFASYTQFSDLKKRMMQAIDNGDFKLYLQPKVDMKTGCIDGAEALVRWVDPSLGMIPLSDFLPEMETKGLIMTLDLHLFEKACEKIELWIKKYGKEIKISVNLSKYCFGVEGFFNNYREVFEKFDIPRRCIEIELLESIVLDNTKRLREVVGQINEYGFTCALDDFGSGFSSYSVLATTNIAVLKIDRSLFQEDSNDRDKIVIDHIVKTAHELGMMTVAEGIETQEYVNYMRKIGCDCIQGFVFYKPMPIEEFEERFVIGNEKVPLE